MKALNELVSKLKAEGHDTCELESMISSFEASGTDRDEMDFYLNQIYGVLVGLSILGYITADKATGIQNAIEEGSDDGLDEI